MRAVHVECRLTLPIALVLVEVLGLGIGLAVAGDDDNPPHKGTVYQCICTMNRDGSQIAVVAKEPFPGKVLNGAPRWSPDGRSILFDSTTADKNWSSAHIYSIAMSGSQKGSFTDLGLGVTPVWSPDGKTVAFTLNPGNPDGARSGIWIMNPDGSGREHLADGVIPFWTPDGRIAYADSFGAVRNIFVLDPRKGKTELLIERGSKLLSKSRLTWINDGLKLAFAPARPTRNELFWIVDLAQTNRPIRRFGTVPAGNDFPSNWGYPAWSPDGTQVVFQMFPQPNGGPSLYSISAESPGVPQRFKFDNTMTHQSSADWSPDSQKIAFSCRLVE